MISSIGTTPFPFTKSGDGLPGSASGSRNTAVSVTAATAQRSVDGQLQLTTKEGTPTPA
jgi:hypothetical protein